MPSMHRRGVSQVRNMITMVTQCCHRREGSHAWKTAPGPTRADDTMSPAWSGVKTHLRAVSKAMLRGVVRLDGPGCGCGVKHEREHTSESESAMSTGYVPTSVKAWTVMARRFSDLPTMWGPNFQDESQKWRGRAGGPFRTSRSA
eukprot:scaffold305563_cov35-Tisochrysis_lutea.AAC.2